MPDLRCSLCGAPVHERRAPDEDRTVRLDAHASPLPLAGAYVLRVDQTVRRAGPGSAHVYREHACSQPQERIDHANE